MSVSITIPDRDRENAARNAPAGLDDYTHPDEPREGKKVLALWLGTLLVLIGAFAFFKATQSVAIGIFVWWLLSCIGYFFIAPKIVLRRLRMHGPQIAVNARSHPQLHALINKGSGMLRIAPPDAYLLPEGISQLRLFTPPDFLMLTQAGTELLRPNELNCLVLRQLVHLRQNHARRLMLIKLLTDTPPPLRILVWPVGIYSFYLRMRWTELAEMTADRLTLLVVKNHKLLVSALIKQHAATDPLMAEHNISAADVDTYVAQEGFIALEGRQISTQYRLGQAIQENPYLEERVKELNRFARSAEYKEAIEKLAPAKKQSP